MYYRQTKLVLGLTLLLFVPSASAWGQIGGGLGGQGGVGGARGIGGVRGLSSPRGGLDFRSNPIANPPPSLTPHEVFHPQGSLSSGQVLNPAPSLRRPRSAGSVPTLRQPGATAGSVYGAAQPSNTVHTGRQPVISTPVGQRLQQSASTLERRLTQVAPDKGWEEYLSCATLREVQRSSKQPSNTQRRELQALLERYESVAAEKKYKIVSRLPEFQRTVGTLQEYLRPMDGRRRDDLRHYIDQLGDQLQQFTNGESWARFLALPKELLNDETNQVVSKETSKLLRRFDKLSGNPKYAEIAALPAFRPAHEALKALAVQTSTSPPPSSVKQQPSVAPPDPQDRELVATGDQEPVAPGDRQPVTSGDAQPVASEDQEPVAGGAQPIIGDSTELPLTDPEPPRVPVGERILESVVTLDLKLAKVAPNSEWPKRLSLDELRGVVPVSSERPANDSERKSLADILETYQQIAKDKENAVVNELPEFKETLEALHEYLKPTDAQLPKD